MNGEVSGRKEAIWSLLIILRFCLGFNRILFHILHVCGHPVNQFMGMSPEFLNSHLQDVI